jgi:hypothetical protein
MSEIVLTDEQARAVTQAGGPVTVTDRRGNTYTPIQLELSAERIAELKRRAAAPGPRYTGAHIQAMLRALEVEWQRTGGFDEEYVVEFVRRFNAGEVR